MINLCESMGLGWDLTCDPWICSQTHCQVCWVALCRHRHATRLNSVLWSQYSLTQDIHDLVPNCITLYRIETSFSTFANRVDPDQAALVRAAPSGSSLFAFGNKIYQILHKWIWTLVSLFYVPTWKFIYIIVHSGWSFKPEYSLRKGLMLSYGYVFYFSSSKLFGMCVWEDGGSRGGRKRVHEGR